MPELENENMYEESSPLMQSMPNEMENNYYNPASQVQGESEEFDYPEMGENVPYMQGEMPSMTLPAMQMPTPGYQPYPPMNNDCGCGGPKPLHHDGYGAQPGQMMQGGYPMQQPGQMMQGGYPMQQPGQMMQGGYPMQQPGQMMQGGYPMQQPGQMMQGGYPMQQPGQMMQGGYPMQQPGQMMQGGYPMQQPGQMMQGGYPIQQPAQMGYGFPTYGSMQGMGPDFGNPYMGNRPYEFGFEPEIPEQQHEERDEYNG